VGDLGVYRWPSLYELWSRSLGNAVFSASSRLIWYSRLDPRDRMSRLRCKRIHAEGKPNTIIMHRTPNLLLEPTRAALYVTNVGSRSDRPSLRWDAIPGACGLVLRSYDDRHNKLAMQRLASGLIGCPSVGFFLSSSKYFVGTSLCGHIRPTFRTGPCHLR